MMTLASRVGDVHRVLYLGSVVGETLPQYEQPGEAEDSPDDEVAEVDGQRVAEPDVEQRLQARVATMISRMTATTPRIAAEQAEHDAAGCRGRPAWSPCRGRCRRPARRCRRGRPPSSDRSTGCPAWATRLAVGVRRARWRRASTIEQSVEARRPPVRRRCARRRRRSRSAPSVITAASGLPSSSPASAVGEHVVEWTWRCGRAIRRTRRVDPDPR